MTAAIKALHLVDPRQALLDQTRRYADAIKPLGARVLIATYVRPEKTAGGIIMTERTRDEDSFQGKCGLVIALGPLAFKDDENHAWGDLKPKVGDWVLTNIGDTRRLQVGQNPCRFVEDVHVQCIVDEPDSVW
jgi:co-chaperonin GroES (HSP10)